MLDDLRERLLREGVKPAIVGRYVAELSDHLEDLREHLPRDVALSHLGSPEVLAEAMLAQPGVRSWTARAPWAVLTLGPVLGLVLACLLPTLLLFMAVRAFAADLDYGRAAEPGSWPYSILDLLFAFNEHLLPIVVGWIAVGAKGKLPVRMPKFIEADNGLAASAALRGGDYLTRIILHIAGMDPPLAWVPPPKTAEVIPAWMDESVVMPAALTTIAMPGCGKSDFSQLAARLKEEPTPAASPPPQGLIHVYARALRAVEPGVSFDNRMIYGHSSDDCILSARN